MAADPLTAATIDELLNFDDSDAEDPFNENPSRADRDDNTSHAKRKAGDENDLDAALGLDEEVQITKKRKPIVKLDEERLLSAPGIPKIRQLARSGKASKHMRLKGKGHEFSDVARLLNYYQLWLDNLYPRAKFADGLQLVEKAGHSRRMQVMRREWIDEGKPGYIRDKERKKDEQENETDDLYAGDEPTADSSNKKSPDAGAEANDDSLFIPDSRPARDVDMGGDDLPEDDELEALLAEQDDPAPRTTSSRGGHDNDSEGEDDLDALLAEQETSRAPLFGSATVPKPNPKPQRAIFDDDDDDDEDDLDALLAEQESRVRPSTAPSTAQSRQATIPDRDQDEDLLEDDDDLDALLAEQEARAGLGNNAKPQSSGASKVATQPTAVVADEDNAANGEDMFSSSPLRNTAPFNASMANHLLEDEELPSEQDAVAVETRREITEIELDVQMQEDVAPKQDENDLLEDAGDMFSSSPVQNE